VDQLDDIFFADYMDRKKKAVSDIIREGILNSGIDWYKIAKPTGKSEKMTILLEYADLRCRCFKFNAYDNHIYFQRSMLLSMKLS